MRQVTFISEEYKKEFYPCFLKNISEVNKKTDHSINSELYDLYLRSYILKNEIPPLESDMLN